MSEGHNYAHPLTVHRIELPQSLRAQNADVLTGEWGGEGTSKEILEKSIGFRIPRTPRLALDEEPSQRVALRAY